MNGSKVVKHVNPISKGLSTEGTICLWLLGVFESNMAKDAGFVTRRRLAYGAIVLFSALVCQTRIDVTVEVICKLFENYSKCHLCQFFNFGIFHQFLSY